MHSWNKGHLRISQILSSGSHARRTEDSTTVWQKLYLLGFLGLEPQSWMSNMFPCLIITECFWSVCKTWQQKLQPDRKVSMKRLIQVTQQHSVLMQFSWIPGEGWYLFAQEILDQQTWESLRRRHYGHVQSRGGICSFLLLQQWWAWAIWSDLHVA